MAARAKELTEKAIRFYERYGSQIEQVKELLCIKLRQLCLAYTINNKLPPEAVYVKGRVKSLTSFIKKLDKMKWPSFYYPTEVVRDLIGARIVCWFIDDCYGILEFMRASHQFDVIQDDTLPIRDYIKEPQAAGYRALHVFTRVEYDGVKKTGSHVTIVPERIICEVQIRTKLQDAWADTTHEFFWKAKSQGVESQHYEGFLSTFAERLAAEDKSLITMRNAYQEMATGKDSEGTREGFRGEAWQAKSRRSASKPQQGRKR